MVHDSHLWLQFSNLGSAMPQVGKSRSQNYLSALSLRKPKCSWEHIYSYHCLPTHTQNSPQTLPSPKQNKNSIFLKRHSCISVESKKISLRKLQYQNSKNPLEDNKNMRGLVHIVPALRNLLSICQARIDEDPLPAR